MDYSTLHCRILWNGNGTTPRTGKDGLPHTLPGDVTMLLAVSSKGGLKDKSANLVLPLKLGPSLLQFLCSKIWLHVCDLDVGVVHVQGGGDYLCVCARVMCVSVCEHVWYVHMSALGYAFSPD